MEDTLLFEQIYTQTIEADWLQRHSVELGVLRLDLVHALISGNKWFKLKYYLNDAQQRGFDTIATYGGPYSNHIIATAFACHRVGLKSMGIIRGEGPPVLSSTLQQAVTAGMDLQFVNRAAFNDKASIEQHFNNVYWVNEGGYGKKGAQGAREILSYCQDASTYTHIVCAVGTGTMMAGLITAADESQEVTGVSVMKGNYDLLNSVVSLLDETDASKNFNITHDYHFGGYAKHPPKLISYMNHIWHHHNLPTDIVYTSKTFYAIEQMIRDTVIPAGSRVLMIHSGGLQGNDSLPERSLAFS